MSHTRQIHSKPLSNASSMKRESKQGRSFKCCAHCGKMAPANNKKFCDGCGTAFPIKINANSKQGRSFKCCADCDHMAGSNNQKKCKKCGSTNWAKSKSQKRKTSSVKRSTNNAGTPPAAKKRKKSGKNMFDDMLSLLDSPPKNEPAVAKATPLDLFNGYELSDDNSMFDEMMSELASAPKSLTRESSLTMNDDMFNDFISEMDAEANAEEFEDDILSMDWLDDIMPKPKLERGISV